MSDPMPDRPEWRPQQARDYLYVYRLELDEPIEVPPRDDLQFIYCQRPLAAGPALSAMTARWGTGASLKTLLTLISASRELYLLLANNELVQHCWVQLGTCDYYHVEPTSAVIHLAAGTPDETTVDHASQALQRALAALHRRRIPVVYVDVADTDVAGQEATDVCGFGPPAAVTFRQADAS